MNAEITRFIAHAREKGMDHATIRMLLLSAGWKEKDVAKALTEQALAMPVPAPPDTGGARDAFLHLVGFSALYASAVATITLLFDGVNRLWPDPAMDQGRELTRWAAQEIRWNIAILVVAFPLFLLLSRLLLKEMCKQPEKSWSPIRKWLTYLTLFVAAVTLGTDFITVVFYFLQGELSLRFVLKVAIVAGIAGMAFVYYLRTVRMPAATLGLSRMHRGFGLAGSVVVAASLVWGLALVGLPGTARVKRLDERRVNDLIAISETMDRICLGAPLERVAEPEPEMLHPLPADLQAVAAQAVASRPSITDPVSGEPYEYRVTGPSTYELCAAFDLPRDVDDRPRFNHPAGRSCFGFDVVHPE